MNPKRIGHCRPASNHCQRALVEVSKRREIPLSFSFNKEVAIHGDALKIEQETAAAPR
jgi:hypothetical protein